MRSLIPFIVAGVCAAQAPQIPKDGPELFTTASGLQYSVLNPGNGKPPPQRGDVVVFHYAGWLTDGQLFESSLAGPPRRMTLGVAMPKAWIEGLELMSPGARFKFIVPPRLGYGKAGTKGSPPAVPGVPPNATLIFEMELFDIEKGRALPVFQLPNTKKQKSTKTGLTFEVLQPGTGHTPEPGERFTVAFDLFNESGQLVATSRAAEHETIVGRVGKPLEGPAFLPEAIGLLHVGERVRFDVPAELCYGSTGNGFLVPPDSRTVWVLELIRLDPPPRPRPVPAFAVLQGEEVTRTPSGLRFAVVTPGEGRQPKPTDTVEIHYAGWLSTRRCFDETFTTGVPLEIDLGAPRGKLDLVPGLREGLPHMRVGAVYRFVLPSGLGYGLRGRKDLGIGPDRRLYFYVELVGIRNDD